KSAQTGSVKFTCPLLLSSDLLCSKDEECCSTQMCVWGQCTANVSRGTEGTICQGQNDCRPELCCAFQRGKLLFPVCNPKPQRGESCLNHPNLLMDMLAWDQEGPRDHCQCADHLQCRQLFHLEKYPGGISFFSYISYLLQQHLDSNEMKCLWRKCS
uniref:Dickkopf WNT signaling pathway inhibitor 3b n=1 Tax=Oryzias latipes TaxID=8090 RepID=H2MYF0_ORYLA